MLEFWLISIVFWHASEITCNELLKKKGLNMGIILKGEKLSNKKIIKRIIGSIIPIFNVLTQILNIILATCILRNDGLFLKIFQDLSYRPEYIDKVYKYKKNLFNKNGVKDAMILDGADNTQIKNAIKYCDCSKQTFDGELLITEKDDRLANAMILSEQLLYEIECNIELSLKEKKKLLSSLRKMYLLEISKGKSKIKPLEKGCYKKLLNEEPVEIEKAKQIVKK